MGRVLYRDSVFLNFPFDRNYKPILYALIFAVFDCGFVPRSTLERDDSTAVRIQTLYELINESKYGIHDISRIGLDSKNRLPRFNMPLELGIFLGSKVYGTGRHRAKRGLILDRERFRYQKFCSDIAGQDIRGHQNRVEDVIRCVRNWFRASPDTAGKILPGANFIYNRYLAFRRQLPQQCEMVHLDLRDLHFIDYTTLVAGWLKENPR